MRVLLLGGTGHLGRRCIPSFLSHGHILTVYVRNPSKLESMISRELLDLLESVVVGDATDVECLEKAIRDHDIEGIVNVAGNLVGLWQEFLLPKIARSVGDAAVKVGRERGKPLRVWITSGSGILRLPGTEWLLQDYTPKFAMSQHDATRAVTEPYPLTEIHWSLLCVALMLPLYMDQTMFTPLPSPRPQGLITKATYFPGQSRTWVYSIPIIGPYLDIWVILLRFNITLYEAVADFLSAELAGELDLEEDYVGKRVGIKMSDMKGMNPINAVRHAFKR